MGIEREDIVQVLNPHEIPLMERAEAAGFRPNSFYQKLRQFKATYPDTWQEEVDKWLDGAKEIHERESRVAGLREKVRAKRIELLSIDHENEEEALLAELDELEGRINAKREGEPAPSGAKKGKGKKPEKKNPGDAPEEGEE